MLHRGETMPCDRSQAELNTHVMCNSAVFISAASIFTRLFKQVQNQLCHLLPWQKKPKNWKETDVILEGSLLTENYSIQYVTANDFQEF